MRRAIPHLLLALVTVLAVAGALLGIASSPLVVSFSQPEPGNPGVVASLHGMVRVTLDSQSFELTEPGFDIAYRAPDRTQSAATTPQIVIGTTMYLALEVSSGVVTRWGKMPLTPQLDAIAGPSRVKSVLEQILQLDSVDQKGGTFTVRQVGPANNFTPGSLGDALVTYVVRTAGGHVVGIVGTAQGKFNWFAVSRSGQLEKVTRNSLQPWNQTFARFGAIAPILPPPPSRTVKLPPCGQGSNAPARGGANPGS